MARRIRESPELGAFLTKIFDALHITQKDLADRLNARIGGESNLSQSLISRLLGKQANLDLDSPLADALCAELSFDKGDLELFFKPKNHRVPEENWVAGVEREVNRLIPAIINSFHGDFFLNYLHLRKT